MLLKSTEVLSDVVGRLTDRMIKRVVRKEAFAACGVYCFVYYCGNPSCATTQPDMYHCHDYCTGDTWYQCFPYQPYYCAGFCYYPQC